jgi:creatinine amidohydrolase
MSGPFYFDRLTWPDVNNAARNGKIPIFAVGCVEEHGRHLPLLTDWLIAHRVAEEASARSGGRLLVMPPVSYGYITHGMDFPGCITLGWQHLFDQCLDITKSLAYHGFRKMIIINGHGSNWLPLELVGRRTNLETEATCAVTDCMKLLAVDPQFRSGWKDGEFPEGSHGGDVETSLILYLAPETVRKEKIARQKPYSTKEYYSDVTAGRNLFNVFGWTSATTPSGSFGRPDLSTPERGHLLFEEMVKQMVTFVKAFDKEPYVPRVDHHPEPPTMHFPG